MKSLGDALQHLLGEIGLEKPVKQHRVFQSWPSIVGARIAKHTEVEKIEYNKLYVRVSTPTWRNELVFQKKRILNRINEMLGNTTVITDIIFK